MSLRCKVEKSKAGFAREVQHLSAGSSEAHSPVLMLCILLRECSVFLTAARGPLHADWSNDRAIFRLSSSRGTPGLRHFANQLECGWQGNDGGQYGLDRFQVIHWAARLLACAQQHGMNLTDADGNMLPAADKSAITAAAAAAAAPEQQEFVDMNPRTAPLGGVKRTRNAAWFCAVAAIRKASSGS